ncbi:MAG TPA: hypothetical protein VHE12_11305 [bacterium]|nr:hypothetical protein [bacterium]
MRCIPACLFLFILALPLRAEWIQGDGFSYSLDAPVGWVLDRSLASQVEADLVLYPQGSSYYKADSVITLSTFGLGGKVKTVQDLVQKDAQDGKASNPKMEILKGPILSTKQLRSVPVYLYTRLKDGTCEAVAYVGEEDRVILFVLSCPNVQVLHEDLPALKETVGSYGSLPEKDEDAP